MQNITLILIFTISLFSCSSESKEGGSTDLTVDTFESNSSVCDPSSNVNFLGYIKSGSIGVVNLGVNHNVVSKDVKYDVKTIDQIVPLEDGTQTTKKIHHVYYNMTEVMLLESDGGHADVVNSITTFSPFYYLGNCVHVGSTVGFLQEQYHDLNVMLNFDDNMLYVVSKDNPSAIFMLMADNILDQSKINQIDGQTSMSNINPKGIIMSIRISN